MFFISPGQQQGDKTCFLFRGASQPGDMTCFLFRGWESKYQGILKECLSICTRPSRIWSAEDTTCFLFRAGPNKKHVVSQSRQGQATRRRDMFIFSRTRQIIINTTCFFGPPNKKHVASEIKNMSCLEPCYTVPCCPTAPQRHSAERADPAPQR